MKKYLVSICLFVVALSISFAQDKNFTVRSGAGFYADAMGLYNGPIIWLEGGYKLKSGFYLNGRLSLASIDWKISDGFFEGYKTILLRQMADLTFSRPVRVKGRHYIEPGLGFKLKREDSFYPDLTIQTVDQQTVVFTRYSQTFYEIGFTICLDYYYEFAGNFYMGVRLDSNVIWALGLEGLSASPLLGFRF